MLQVLSLANHPRVWQKVADPKGRAAAVMNELPDDRQRIEELYLITLSRLPRDSEMQLCQQYLAGAQTPAHGIQGILWGLLNTREFLFQH